VTANAMNLATNHQGAIKKMLMSKKSMNTSKTDCLTHLIKPLVLRSNLDELDTAQ
jgi:hypothetical protein